MKKTSIFHVFRFGMSVSGALLCGAVCSPNAFSQEMTVVPAPPPAVQGSYALKMVAERSALGNKPVTDARYSADEVTTTTQTMADGNRIVHTSTAHVDRDNSGRTRVEHTIGNIGGVATADAHKTVMINDPVAGVHYMLRPDSRTAQKIAFPGWPPAGKAGDKATADKVVAERMQLATSTSPTATLSFITEDGPMIDGMPGAISFRSVDVANSSKTETADLGTQTMEGLPVKGTRVTTTIPAGSVGNELPLKIVDESWYSADLQIALKTVHSDPRLGETVFTVSNVSRENPDPSLFQVPADYQVTEGPTIKRDTFVTGSSPSK